MSGHKHVRPEERRRMTGEELRTVLSDFDISVADFAWFTGANPRTVERWLAGQQDIPPHIPIMIHLFDTYDDAMDVAEKFVRTTMLPTPV